MDLSQIVNIVVAFSNFYGLKILTLDLNYFQICFFTTVIIASFLMHISEQKHGLHGISPFSSFSNKFLWLDRITANFAMLYILYSIHIDYCFWHQTYSFDSIKEYILQGECFNVIFPYLLLGFSSLAISENWPNINKILFVVTHCIWHYCAFEIIYIVMMNNINNEMLKSRMAKMINHDNLYSYLRN